jgi:hypothetical protein
MGRFGMQLCILGKEAEGLEIRQSLVTRYRCFLCYIQYSRSMKLEGPNHFLGTPCPRTPNIRISNAQKLTAVTLSQLYGFAISRMDEHIHISRNTKQSIQMDRSGLISDFVNPDLAQRSLPQSVNLWVYLRF